MGACWYIVRKQWKNILKEKIKRPHFWLWVLVICAYFALYIYQEISHTGITGVIDDPLPVYKGGVTLVFLFTAFLGLGVGLKRGNTFFRPCDVTHLFVSPIHADKILLYGLFRKCVGVFLATLLLLSQLTNLRFYFGLGWKQLLLLMCAWLMLSISLTVLSLGVYSVTATHPWIRKLVLFFIYALSAMIIIGIVMSLWKSGKPVTALLSFFNKPYLRIVPLGGWASGFLVCAMEGEYYQAAVYAGLLVLLPLIGLVLVYQDRSAYYEDVLTSIGHTYGNVEEERTATTADVRKRTTKRGSSRLVGKKSGEVALMQRQLTEQKRSLILILDKNSLGLISFSVIVGAILHSLMRKGMYPVIMQIIGLAVLCYAMLFAIPMGRFVEELKKPFIFLMPGTPVRKLFYASSASVAKAFLEGLLSMMIITFFSNLNPLFILCGTAFYTSAALLFCAAYLASIRVIGLTNSKYSHTVLSFAILSAVFLFEISVGARLGTRLYAVSEFMFPLVFVVMAAFNTLFSLVFFYSARSILQYRD